MLKKTPALLLTFRQTVQAMACENYCREHALPGRLIPVPREITAGCGLCWKAPPEAEETLCRALADAGLMWSGVYLLEI